MELEARQRTLATVTGYPGLHLAEVARLAALDPKHAKYHLATLERHGLVRLDLDGGLLRAYPRREGPLGSQDTLPPADRTALAALRKPVPLQAALLMLELGAVTVQDLQEATGLARTTLLHHLKRLERAGLLAPAINETPRRFVLADPGRVRRLLVANRPPDALVAGFLDAWSALDLG